MESSTTQHIVNSITESIVQHQLRPGAKLVEQKLADKYGVSRTLVRQALFQLAKKQLIRLEPARGAFISAPSIDEAKQIFEVRRLLEVAMVKTFCANATKTQINALRKHVQQERLALDTKDVQNRTELLGDFHVRMAELMDNDVLAQMLTDLLSRCAIITMMYQNAGEAEHSHAEHSEILDAIAAKDANRAAQLMFDHLTHVETPLTGTHSC